MSVCLHSDEALLLAQMRRRRCWTQSFTPSSLIYERRNKLIWISLGLSTKAGCGLDIGS